MNPNFAPHQQNRGAAGGRPFNSNYRPGAPNSPAFQPGLMMQQRQPSNGSPYPNQAPMRGPNSPYMANRSPAMPSPHMQQQVQMQNGPPMPHPYAPYPQQHLQPNVNPPISSRPVSISVSDLVLSPSTDQQNGVSNSSTFHTQLSTTPQQSNTFVRYSDLDLTPQSGGYDLFLTMVKNPYGPPQPFDGNYYYPQQYGMHPNAMQFQNAPPSPRNYPPTQLHQQPFMPVSFSPSPHTQGMSRASSQQGPERPSSTLGQAPAPAAHTSHTPAPSSGSPAPSTTAFARPERRSAAIVIKNADGEVLDFKKKGSAVTTPPAPTPSRGPVVVSSGAGVPSTSTPPPRASVPSPLHARTESQQAKSKEDIKREFQEKIKAQAQGDESDDKKKKEEADQKAAKEKEDAERKAKEEEESKAALEKEAEEKTKKEAAAKKEAEAKEEADKADKAKEVVDEAERKRKEEEEEQERWIAELEAQEREEEEREKAYREKKRLAAEEKAKADAANEEEELRRQEREAEEREELKAKTIQAGEGDAEAKALFAQLKTNTQFGPAATAATSVSGASTPVSESAMPPPASTPAPAPAVQAAQAKPVPSSKQKPAALKLETSKPIEPAQPTAAMQSLKSARFLSVQNDSVTYPEGILSPNPALNNGAKKVGQRYDKNFLMQFQEVFKEKPSVDWDKMIKETVGDSSDSARPQSARTPSAGGRQASRGPNMPSALNPMGSFVSSRQLPAGSTSEQRFQASLGAQPPAAGRPAAPNPFGSFGGGGRGAFPAPGMIRSTSSQSISQGGGMNSPRNQSQRGPANNRGSRRGGNHQQEAQLAKTMPLTAGVDLKPLEVSKSGWKPASIVAPVQVQVVPGTHMPPDLVQRKVKAALNKMTPEKFDKIADDILTIASQSRDESDGRTLRQVIQLTFEKACDEAHWASMYAKFCKRMLEEMRPEIKDENVRDRQGAVVVGGALFRKYLLNRCQEEFERGWEVNLPTKPEGQSEEVMLSDEYYIAAAAKRRGLGLIQFIGELYKLGMLTLRIMHECVIKLLQFEGLPDEAAVESLVKLLRTIGATMDADAKGHTMIDQYFDRISTVKNMEGLPSRLNFMLLDIMDLRAKRWRSKDDQKGPKTIQEIREDAIIAAQAADAERQRRPGGRPPAGRGDARSFSQNMPPPDYPRNQVGMDDLKKLTRNARQTNSGPSSLGPTSLLGSRSNSGRRGLGPMSRGGEDSGASSRTGTPPVKESTAHVNAYRYVLNLELNHYQ
jgi:translation initiation factor 4G